MNVNKKTLSDIFGYSERSFTEFQKLEGFPIEKRGDRGQSNEYNTAKVFQWLLQRELGKGKESYKDRRDRLEGDRLELTLARELGEVVPRLEIEKAWSNLAINIRKQTMQGNTKLKGEIDVVHGTDIDIEILNEHSRAILTQLSAYDPDAVGSGSECDGEVSSTASDKHE